MSKLTKERCEQIAVEVAERWKSPEYKQKVGAAISRATKGKVKHTPETRERMSKAKKGVPLAKETLQKIADTKKKNSKYPDLDFNLVKFCACGCGAQIKILKAHKRQGIPDYIKGHHHSGKNKSLEVRTKISKTLTGKKNGPHTKETCEKISKANTGYRHTDESKKTMSEQRRGVKKGPRDRAIVDKITKANKGRKRSKEFCALISKLKTGKKTGPRSEETRNRQRDGVVRHLLEKDINYGWRHCKKGYFISTKNVKPIFYSSSFEERAYCILEQLAKVRSFEKCKHTVPYVFNGNRIYIPDITVTYADNSIEIIEVKPKELVNDPKNQAKFTAATEFCKINNFEFSVWTQTELGI